MKNVGYSRAILDHLKRSLKLGSISGLLLIVVGCDFDNLSDFQTPTWFVDLKFPLTQEKYGLDGLVDNKQIFPSGDSLGLQLIFVDTLPNTSIDPNYLEVDVGAEILYNGTATNAPNLSLAIDTVINVSIPITPGVLTNVNGIPFSVPSDDDQQILAAAWNDIVAGFDTTFAPVRIDLPEIGAMALPEFITEVSGIMIVEDNSTDNSYLFSSITNNGLLTNVINTRFMMSTGSSVSPDTLANHYKSTLGKNSTFTRSTLIGDQQLKDAIHLLFDFDVATHGNDTDTLTVNAGDSLQVNFSVRIRVAGVDEAVVQISEYELPVELPAVTLPSTIAIYSGVLKTGTTSGINEVAISNLRSTYPFYMDFVVDFKNLIPSASGGDSVKVDTVLHKDYATYFKTFKIDGYTFVNPAGTDSALSQLNIDLRARLRSQTAFIPLDGSELGHVTIGVSVDEMHFQSLEAIINELFPSSAQNVDGIPTGFSGMAFTGVWLEFDMINSIDLPVQLDVDMVGYNTLGDSAVVEFQAAVARPSSYGSDSTRTIIRLSRLGTTVLSYASADATTWSDSTTTPPSAGTVTIVDFMSLNPSLLVVRPIASIDGRGTIDIDHYVGGTYRIVAPFEVRVDPMTFIPITETPIQEFAHDIRNRIRSTLVFAQLTSTVTNSIPIAGDISILLSNETHFPLDTTREMLSILRDTLAAQNPSWFVTDSIYVLNQCAHLNPESFADELYIFSVMNDFSDCYDGVVYLIKYNPWRQDTVFSFIDTLLKVVLPEPAELYSDTSTIGHPGQTKSPGVITSISEIDTNKLFLLTDYGDRYIVPRFHLNGTDGKSVYMTVNDNIHISTYLVLRMSNTGMFETAPDEIVLLYPNGGETLTAGTETAIRWKTYGTPSTVDLAYSIDNNPQEDDWVDIQVEIDNVDSLLWTPTVKSDSVRIRIRAPNSLDEETGNYQTMDRSSWYFSVLGSQAAKLAGSKLELVPVKKSFTNE